MLLTLLSNQSGPLPPTPTRQPDGGFTVAEWNWYLKHIKKLRDAVNAKDEDKAQEIAEQIEAAPVIVPEIKAKRAELVEQPSIDYLSVAQKMAQVLSVQILEIEALLANIERERQLQLMQQDEEEALMLLM